MPNLTATGYITTDKDETAIWSVGATADDALAAAAEWADDTADLLTFPATEALIAKVRADGGAIAWAYSGMIACTVAEAEAVDGEDE